jgi:hypothetical protein
MAKFSAGQTGNPGGRPKGAVEVRDLARKHTVAAPVLKEGWHIALKAQTL